MRATSRLSSPAALASPRMTSSISAGSRSGRAVEERAQRVRGEVVGPGLRQRAAVAPERRADDSIDVGGSHRRDPIGDGQRVDGPKALYQRFSAHQHRGALYLTISTMATITPTVTTVQRSARSGIRRP